MTTFKAILQQASILPNTTDPPNLWYLASIPWPSGLIESSELCVPVVDRTAHGPGSSRIQIPYSLTILARQAGGPLLLKRSQIANLLSCSCI